MCLIIVSRANGARPSSELLDKSAKANQDGIGIAWTENGSVRWRKGISQERLKELLARIPEESSVVVHHRLATIGAELPALCHPFPLSATLATEGSIRTGVIFHNGHWSAWRDRLWPHMEKLPQGPWSDSRAIAWLAGRYGDRALEFIDEKVALLTPSGVRIFGGPWKEHEGLTVSNLNFLSTFPKYTYCSGGGSVVVGDTVAKPFRGKLSKAERRAIREEVSRRFAQLPPDVVEIDQAERDARSFADWDAGRQAEMGGEA